MAVRIAAATWGSTLIRRIWDRARSTELAQHGVVLFVALAVANLSNYLFHVVISRLLGPEQYGALAALLSAFILISVPAGAMQVVSAKRISVLRARGDSEGAGRLLKGMLRGSLVFALAPAAVLAGLASTTARFLHLDSYLPTLLLAAFVVPAAVGPVSRGALQGRLQFKRLSIVLVSATLLRLAMGVAFVKMGFGVAGAVGASVASEAIGLVLATFLLRDLLAAGGRGPTKIEGIIKDAQDALLALCGFWAVVSLDSVLVRHYFPSDVAGFYGAAAVAAHAVLFATGAVAMVAFPRFAESEGRSVEARRVLFQSIVAVTFLGAMGALLLSAFSTLVVRTLFGVDYLGGTAVLGILALAMAFMGVTNVLVYFHLASSPRALWSLPVAVLGQVGGIYVFHESMVQVALVMVAVTGALMLFNLVAAYASPRELEVLPGRGAELWEPAVEEVEVSVVTPSYNPGLRVLRNLQRLVSVLNASGIRYEVIVVSDGSTDGSHEIIGELASGELRLIHYGDNRGKGFALRTGLARARGKYIVFIDSDGDLDPAQIRSFITLMDTFDADVVLGSKRHSMSKVSYPLTRRLMSTAYYWVVRTLFGLRVHDTQTGLKLVKREVLARVLPRMLEKRFAFDLELLVVAKRLGYDRFFEAPVTLDYQFESTVSSGSVFRILVDTAAIFYRCYILRYYDRPALPPVVEADSQETDVAIASPMFQEQAP